MSNDTIAWIIDEDHLEGQGPDSAVGTICGIDKYEDFPEDSIRFRLFDDDGIHYYSGRVSAQGMEDDEALGGAYTAYLWGQGYAGTTDFRANRSDLVRLSGWVPEANQRWVSIFG